MPNARVRRTLTIASGLALSVTGATIAFDHWGGWQIEVAVVALLLPVLILCGATYTLPERWRGVARYAGALSYPLYAVHLPVLIMVSMASRHIGPGALLLGVTVSASIVSAWLARNVLAVRISRPSRASHLIVDLRMSRPG